MGFDEGSYERLRADPGIGGAGVQAHLPAFRSLQLRQVHPFAPDDVPRDRQTAAFDYLKRKEGVTGESEFHDVGVLFVGVGLASDDVGDAVAPHALCLGMKHASGVEFG